MFPPSEGSGVYWSSYSQIKRGTFASQLTCLNLNVQKCWNQPEKTDFRCSFGSLVDLRGLVRVNIPVPSPRPSSAPPLTEHKVARVGSGAAISSC